MAAAGDALALVPWATTDLPDLLWLCSMLQSGDYNDMLRVGSILDAIDRALEDAEDLPKNFVQAGQLTQLESLSESSRERILRGLESSGLYESAVPEEFAISLGMYPDAPGRWIIRPRLERGLSIDPVVARRYLGAVLSVSLDGRAAVPTMAKAMVMRQHIKAGKIRFVEGLPVLDAIPRYPFDVTKDEREHVESFIRAFFSGFSGARAHNEEGTRAEAVYGWAKSFWQSNWRLYACEAPTYDHSAVHEEEDVDDLIELVNQAGSAAQELHDRFIQIASVTDPDLFNPDRYEVLTGLVGRILRHLPVLASHPASWTMEHGAAALRASVETRIVLKWLIAREDPEMYRRFKEFGRGRLKLLKLHAEDYVDSLAEPPDGLVAYVAYLDDRVNQDLMEEFQSIDLSGSFSGFDMRRMAAEVGMEREYRLLFAPASSSVHSDWSSIDEYAFQICRNPLHRGHRVVVRDPDVTVGPSLIETILVVARDLLDDYTECTSSQRRIF